MLCQIKPSYPPAEFQSERILLLFVSSVLGLDFFFTFFFFACDPVYTLPPFLLA